MLLDGKVAIVTGASRGIGRAIAAALAREGAKVVINHDVGADAAFGGYAPGQEALAAIEAAGGVGLLVPGDVADPATATKLVTPRWRILAASTSMCLTLEYARSTPSSKCPRTSTAR